VECPQCHSNNPDVARFCYRCGRNLVSADARSGRNGAYAVQTSESVTQFALISTILPHSNREIADNYRWALLASTVLVVFLTLLGLLPMAIIAAAFAIPLVYLIYIYDVNLWEDSPAPVVVALFLVTGLLAAVVSLLFFRWAFDEQFFALLGASRAGQGTSVPIGPLLIFAVLLPVLAEVVKNIGPVWLASQPRFDDMIDGLTFGIAAGTAYAAAETLVAFAPVFGAGFRTTSGIANWIPIVLNLMIVKSLIYGTATGIAVAVFSGRGEGYDGFRPSYYASFTFAAGANVLYWLGVRLLAYAPFGQALGLLWGVLILGVLVIRVRVLLHTALLEAAIEDASAERRHKGATTVAGFCPECEMALLGDAMFCINCGSSVRATSATARRGIRETP
jgi:hypothetical protein